MRRNLRFRRRFRLLAAVAAGASLLVAAAAFAASPLAGKTYTGFTSGPVAYGFKPPVKFRVSGNGEQLLGFRWAGVCLPPGPLPPKAPNHQDPWLAPAGPPGHQIFVFVHNVGTINLGGSGNFSIKNVKTKVVFSGNNGYQITDSTVNGQFKSAKTAVGTIRYTESGYTAKGTFQSKCSRKHSFTATRR